MTRRPTVKGSNAPYDTSDLEVVWSLQAELDYLGVIALHRARSQSSRETHLVSLNNEIFGCDLGASALKIYSAYRPTEWPSPRPGDGPAG